MTATLLVSPQAFDEARLEVEGESYRHHVKARRARVGDRLQVVDGAGRARWAEWESIDRRRAWILLGEPAPSREPRRAVELFVPLPRPERCSWMVEKTTELGVRALRFYHSARAPRDLGDGSLARLERVAASALEQSGGATLPEITGVDEWPSTLSRFSSSPMRWFFEPGGEPVASALDRLRHEPPTLPLAILIGPEGGFEDSERDQLLATSAQRLDLGQRILRLETAAVVGATLGLLGS